FTLVELLVVIGILVMLAAFVGPKVSLLAELSGWLGGRMAA
ncbi:hypothetical protein DF185_23335, partial [Marinifilum breve]